MAAKYSKSLYARTLELLELHLPPTFHRERYIVMRQIAKEAKVEYAWLRTLISGKTKNPSVHYVQQVHDVLEVRPPPVMRRMQVPVPTVGETQSN